MNTKIDAFLAEVRNMPHFVAASASDPKWIEQLDAIERGLNAVERQADNDPAMRDALDNIRDVIGRSDLSLKERLLEVGKIFVQVRDSIKITH
jgi:hypothetical protein